MPQGNIIKIFEAFTADLFHKAYIGNGGSLRSGYERIRLACDKLMGDQDISFLLIDVCMLNHGPDSVVIGADFRIRIIVSYLRRLDEREQADIQLTVLIFHCKLLQLSFKFGNDINTFARKESSAVTQPFFGVMVAADDIGFRAIFRQTADEIVQKLHSSFRGQCPVIHIPCDQERIHIPFPDCFQNLVQYIFLIINQAELAKRFPQMKIPQMNESHVLCLLAFSAEFTVCQMIVHYADGLQK